MGISTWLVAFAPAEEDWIQGPRVFPPTARDKVTSSTCYHNRSMYKHESHYGGRKITRTVGLLTVAAHVLSYVCMLFENVQFTISLVLFLFSCCVKLPSCYKFGDTCQYYSLNSFGLPCPISRCCLGSNLELRG